MIHTGRPPCADGFMPDDDDRKQPPNLTSTDLVILARWGESLRQLYTGEREPETAAQAHFVEATHGKVAPTTRYETAFISLLRIESFKQHQAEPPIEWQPWAPTAVE